MSLNPPLQRSTSSASKQHLQTGDEICSKERIVILQPIALRIPNSHNVYSPSRLRPRKVMSYVEFLARYANHPRATRICFDETPSSATIFERSKLITAYGFGLDCWYVVEPDNVRNILPESED